MKKKEERLEKEIADVRQQNRRLTEPLQKATLEVSELQKQLINYNQDKVLLAVRVCLLISTFCVTVCKEYHALRQAVVGQ